MEEKNMISIVDDKGVTREAEVLQYFNLVEGGPDYVIYSFDEKDENGLIKIYSAVLTETENGPILDSIKTDEEWAQIKEYMRKVVTAAN